MTDVYSVSNKSSVSNSVTKIEFHFAEVYSYVSVFLCVCVCVCVRVYLPLHIPSLPTCDKMDMTSAGRFSYVHVILNDNRCKTIVFAIVIGGCHPCADHIYC